jgi:hypothetical protein
MSKAFKHAPLPIKEEEILKECMSGNLTLWVIYEDKNPLDMIAAVTVRVKSYPGGVAICSEHLGGERADEWIDLLESTMTEYGKEYGATVIEVIGRKGWWYHLKKKGWQSEMVMYHKEI